MLNIYCIFSCKCRYKDDVYDRLWSPLEADNWTPLNSTLTEKNISENGFVVPFAVMRTAYTQDSNMGIYWDRLNTSSRYFFFIHLAELEKLETNQTREFDIYIHGQSWLDGPVRPGYITNTVHSTRGIVPNNEGKIEIWFNSTNNATLPPLVNALEVYRLQSNSRQDTYEIDGINTFFNEKKKIIFIFIIVGLPNQIIFIFIFAFLVDIDMISECYLEYQDRVCVEDSELARRSLFT